MVQGRAGDADPAERIVAAGGVGGTLDAAHVDGLIHGDVEPANILVGGDDFAYLVDFGIGRSVAGSGSTDRDTRAGVSGYEAPEVLQDNEITSRADICSLACVLHECLTGARPHPGGSAEAGLSDDLFEPIPRPSVVHPGTPAAFDAVIARGMAREPADRYRTAGELARAARDALDSTEQRSAATILGDTEAGPPIATEAMRAATAAAPHGQDQAYLRPASERGRCTDAGAPGSLLGEG
ncbi:serine/threonine-protein kinase [Nocardia sp. NPDC004123]